MSAKSVGKCGKTISTLSHTAHFLSWGSAPGPVNRRAVDAHGHRVVLIAIVEISDDGAAPMAEELRMALVDVLRKAGVEQADFLREGVRVLAQELMELEVAE